MTQYDFILRITYVLCAGVHADKTKSGGNTKALDRIGVIKMSCHDFSDLLRFNTYSGELATEFV